MRSWGSLQTQGIALACPDCLIGALRLPGPVSLCTSSYINLGYRKPWWSQSVLDLNTYIRLVDPQSGNYKPAIEKGTLLVWPIREPG
jgi:hypothetical protein